MRADRLIATLLMLHQRGRLSAAQIAAELEVSPRTVVRDVEALAVAGVPIVAFRGPLGGFELMEGFKQRFAGLTVDQARSLAAGTPAGAGDAGHTFLYDPTPIDSVLATRIDLLREAIRVCQVLRARHPTWGDEAVVLYPLALVDKAGTWFLVADLRERRIACAVTDITDLRTTSRRFHRPVDFDLPAFWGGWLAAGRS